MVGDCPGCEVGVLASGTCQRCGFVLPPVAVERVTPCRTCNRRPGMGVYGGRCVECGRCHGETGRGRCTFRAEVFDGWRGTCGWHERVHVPTDNTFEEFEAWIGVLRRARICDRWTHFTPVTLWEGMAGTRNGVVAAPCGEADCPNQPDELPPPGPRRPFTAPTLPTPRATDDWHRARVLEQARQLRAVERVPF